MIRITTRFSTITQLEEDVLSCESHLLIEDTQFMRRNYVRNIFSYYEGVCSLLRENTLAIHTSQVKYNNAQINITLVSLLSEVSFRIDGNGTLKQDEQKQPYKNYLAYSIRSFAEESGVRKNYFGENGWNNLIQSMAIRHKITHPKKDASLDISDEEVASLKSGLEWFQSTIQDIVNSATIQEIVAQ